MSTENDSQTEYETDAEPTPGPWQIRHGVVFSPKHRPGMCEIATILASTPNQQDEANANARLIAATGTAAQKTKKMGYDPQKVVEALPKLLKAVQETSEAVDENGYASVSGLVDAQRKAIDVLKNVKRSAQEVKDA